MTLPLRQRPALRTLVERALVDRLKAELPYLRTIKPYFGEAETVEDLAQARFQTPAIFVWTSDGRPKSIDTRRKRYEVETVIEIRIVSRNLRDKDRVEVHQGAMSGNDPGIYQMLEDTMQTLLGHNLSIDGAGTIGLDQGPTERSVAFEAGYAIWQVRYLIKLTYTVDETVGVEKLTGIDAKINLPSTEDQAANPVVQVSTEVNVA